jgi:hypothetical protein
VFWQVGSSATLGTGTSFAGSILALTSVTVTTGTTVSGRVLARNGAVTLDTNAITRPTCAGTLDISAPSTAVIGTPGAPGTTITGQLGTVTVTDTRGPGPAGWIVSVTASNFITGAGGAGAVVSAGNIMYASGAATATTGNGTFVPSLTAAPLNNVTPLSAFTHANGSGNNSATWNPTLSVHVPVTNVLGSYAGTVTHSVA